ncbi:hypothetical protein BDW62DRAFT_220601 [Aspergillus aurantiobrunneus]
MADSENVINQPGCGFLGHLISAPSIPQFPYQGRARFLNDYKSTINHHEWILVTGVSNEVFEADYAETEDKGSPFSAWCAYDKALGLLLFKMTGPFHGIASETFAHVFINATEPTVMELSLNKIGTTLHSATMGRKRPDKAWRPLRLPHGRSRQWPSAVLEVAYSETTAKLQSDVRYWLRASDGDVKLVFTLHVDQREPRITIEKWESDNGGNGRGHLHQRVVISRRGNGTIAVSGSPLVAGFEKLFLRPPELPRERDIEVNEQKLRHIAEMVWDEQGL